MATTTIDPSRIQVLSRAPSAKGRYVLYWMQQSQRATFNHALEHAVRRANAEKLPLVVGFGLTDDYPGANLRHYRFMLEGLRETRDRLRRRGIALVVRTGDPADVALDLARDAALVVCDRGYMRHQRRWRERVARHAGRRVERVEADVVVPVEVASDKREYAARTIRPKLHAHLDDYLVGLRPTKLERTSLELAARAADGGAAAARAPRLGRIDLDDVDAALDRLDLDHSVPPVPEFFVGGTGEAERRLRRFIEDRLDGYAEHRSEPASDHVSHMSPYLQFGHISPVYIALEVQAAQAPDADRDAYLEELIVRRELAQNFVAWEPSYDRYDALPDWARATLAKHAGDRREHVYTRGQLERAETHDPYWNASMREMRATGYTHNAMRMYWGKKILEWTESPEQAFRTALALDNKYFLDGRGPSAYANVGWIFGLHDRPWKERPIFGTVRYMSAAGLERKSDIAAYVAKVDGLVERAREAGG